MTTSPPLQGVKVVELGAFIAAPYCAKLLCDLGADVVKVELPAGDLAREYGPFGARDGGRASSGLFAYLNDDKSLVRLDLGDGADRARFDQLCAAADVLVEALELAELQQLELAASDLLSSHPNLNVTSISPFGRSGPCAHFRGYGLQAAAGSGLASQLGEPDREPLIKPLNEAEFLAGLNAAAGTLVALRYKEHAGRNQHVDISMLDVLARGPASFANAMERSTGQPIRRYGHRKYGSVLPVKDGYFYMIDLGDKDWRGLMEALGNPEWTRDPKFASYADRCANAEELERLLEELMGDRTRAELWDLSKQRQLSHQPVHRVSEIIDGDHFTAREFMRDLELSSGAVVSVPGPPYRLSRTPAGQPRASDRSRESGPGSESSRPLVDQTNPAMPAPLSGVRVLDLGQVWAGPICAQFLADFGAECIRITPPGEVKEVPPVIPVDAYDTTWRNRIHIGLDMKRRAGMEIFHRLVAVSNVVFNNFSPEAAERLGLTYDALRSVNPRIVVATLSAAGSFGPWKNLRTYGPSLSALYGMKSLLGYPEDGRVQDDVGDLDPCGGTYGALAILAAIRAQERDGVGQFIDLAQGEAAFCGLAEATIDSTLNGRELEPLGNGHRLFSPHGIYPAQGDDEWISIACDSDASWAAACSVVGLEGLTRDERFASASKRVDNRRALDAIFGTGTSSWDKWALTRALQEREVPSYPVLNCAETQTDPHLRHYREKLAVAPSADVRAVDMFKGTPWCLDRTPPTVWGPTTPPGVATEQVCREILGFSDAEWEHALENGAFTA
jgi:crotonobetainyl-CoA:carnitine CoA-transferase CaiB-like acyl-CoA transferase